MDVVPSKEHHPCAENEDSIGAQNKNPEGKLAQ